jgi:hypothetical protein
MAINANTRFKGVDNTLVDLQEKRSAQINNETEFYSITDLSNAITGGADIPALEAQVATNVTDIATNVTDIATNVTDIAAITDGTSSYLVANTAIYTVEATFTTGAQPTYVDGFVPSDANGDLPGLANLKLVRTAAGVYETATNATLFNSRFRLTIEFIPVNFSPVDFFYTMSYDVSGKFEVTTFDSSGVAQDFLGKAIIKYTYFNV